MKKFLYEKKKSHTSTHSNFNEQYFFLKKKSNQNEYTIERVWHFPTHTLYSALAAATCFAPTAKNSEITSRGIPLVSGTLKKTKTHETTQTTA